MRKVFISYHHDNDQQYKDRLVKFGERTCSFIDRSVESGEIPDSWTDDEIRRTIRDRHLRDTTVTIVLVGYETRYRKHVDWEIFSSMYDGSVNRRSGILVVDLTNVEYVHAPYGDEEKRLVHPDISKWTNVGDWDDVRLRSPYLPDRIIDNIVKRGVTISIAPWKKINERNLVFLIEVASENRKNCRYDLSRPMRRRNY